MPFYTLCPRNPANRRFVVTCRVDAPDPKGQCFSLPAWIPGSYLIRDFARHIVSIRAESGGQSVPLTKTDKATWKAAPTSSPLTLYYEVHAGDLSVRAAFIDNSFAFCNASSVFLYPHGQEEAPCQVELLPPEEGGAGWKVATSLPSLGAPHASFGLYQAENYADLLDHPLLMGLFTEINFTVLEVPHRLAIVGAGDNFNRERLAHDLAKIATWQTNLFGEPRLPDPYTFLVMATDSGYGGLEHKNSTVLLIGRDSLPSSQLQSPSSEEETHADNSSDETIPEAYANFLALASHEYFHRWNVKRIRPAALAQNEWQRENYTRLLWFFEGATSYYDDLCLVRARLITESEYLARLGKTITQVKQTPGRHRQSLADASFDAWIKYYRPDENTPNAQISYYSKGALLALWLDLELRRKGKTSLDHLFSELWRDCGAIDAPLEEEEIFRRVAKLGGKDVARALEAFVEGTGDLPLEQSLASVGIRLDWRAEDKTPWLGIRCQTEQGKTRITHVLTDSPGEKAGLIAGDTILALAGREVGSALPAVLARLNAGETISCHYFRRGLLTETQLTPLPPPAETARLTATSSARSKRMQWLGCCAQRLKNQLEDRHP